MQTRIIHENGVEYVMIARADFDGLLEDVEDTRRIGELRRLTARVRSGEEETLPQALADKLAQAHHTGASLVPVWRDYRGLTQERLAASAHISREYLSMIESGRREGTVSTMRAIADALGIGLEDLV